MGDIMVDKRDETVDKQIQKGKEFAGKVLDDVGKTVDGIFESVDSLKQGDGKSKKYNSYREKYFSKIQIDLIESDSLIYIKADLPGVKKEEIDVEIAEDRVAIFGEFKSLKQDLEIDNPNVIISERKSGMVSRIVKLPSIVKINEYSANFDNGVLYLEITKEQPKKIKINIE